MFEGERTALQDDVKPGQIVVAPIYIKSPERPGLYYLEVTLVHEGKYWLEDLGLKRWVTHLYVDQVPQIPEDDLAPRTRRLFAALKRAVSKNNQEEV